MPGAGSGQASRVSALPQSLLKDTGATVAPVELAEVDERLVGHSINPASQQAALEKGAALTPVCEEPSKGSGEVS